MSRLIHLAISLLLISMLRFPEVVAQSNAIVIENAQTGNPASQWDITGAGDLSIQGFATDISYNKGQTARFKIKTEAVGYRIDIYRLGYYQGNGARFIAGFDKTTASPQPTCMTDAATGLVDCGNWAESAQWVIPDNAVSGIYIAKLTRKDTQGASHIAFVVRDDDSHSDLLFQTSDATWQAYNVYGDNNNGRSLYAGVNGIGKASKVSYNRPFLTRAGGGGGGPEEDWLFNSEYPMIRFLEKNGYDMTYTTNADSERRGGLIKNHKVFMSVGHDEYWSKGMRDNVTAARNSGIHLAFFSGNEVYWKTRWENSIANTPDTYRTLVCYKEGRLGENQCNGKCDPSPVWTGLWRSGCDISGHDGCDPENELSGQVSWDGTTGTIQVPADYKNLRFWRNTAVASLQSGSHTLTQNTLGYEWNPEQEDYRSTYPAGRILLSKTVLNGKTHYLTLYKHSSGALVFGAGTVQWSWGLDQEHDRGNAPVNRAMQQATVNLFADMGVQPATRQSDLVAATASTDFTAPTLTVTSPSNGANIPSGTSVNISGTASDANTVAGIEVSTDEGKTWRLATGTTSWNFSWIPSTQGSATIRSRAFDDSGNLSAVNTVNVTITAPAAQPCPCTVFQPTDVPSNNLFNDGNQAIQLGMKFRSATAGNITGVRFYKQAGNTGTHTGQLYSNAGVKLAEVVFQDETASGWQQANFTSPVAIAANTTYVISYHSSSGYYSAVNPYFTSAKVRGPLRGLADNEDGNNGVYKYSATPAFPTDNYQSSNYFVDVVFDDDAEDETPPSVASVSPAANAAGINAQANITVTFNEAVNESTISSATIRLLRAGTVIPAAVTYNAATFTATLNPNTALVYSSSYTIEVKGGSTDPRVKDVAGNALASNFTSTFTTQSTPPPSPADGPGGPILVISSTDNPFSSYPAEILRAEGFNAFAARDISDITQTPTLINSYDVIILGEIALSAANVTTLTNWTNAGGTLIAFKPASQLASLFGITPASGSLSDKYLKINPSGPGAGIVNETIQFHGTANLYTLNGATSLANLYSDAATATNNPAVTTRNVGTNGGKAIAFTYDLAKSIVYTRQGNPAWAGQKRDGQIDPIRSDDLFYPNWVDFSKIEIPQADEQQRLLANIILLNNMHKKPLPRFWYLPRGLKAAVIMTGDDHGSGGTIGRFNDYISKSASNNQSAVDNWTAVRATSYIYPNTPITDAQAAAFQAQGFEISLHLNTNCGNFTPATLRSNFNSQLPALAQEFPSLAKPATNRNHCITWSDWASNPIVELENGIRLDANYYYWPEAWVNNRPGMFTGSGMPMRFADLDGTLIDVYQATTQLTDESGITYSTHINKLLDNATGSKGYYGVFTANMHTDVNGGNSSNGSDVIVAAAQQRQIPVISAKQMLTWLDGRNNSSFGAMSWTNNKLNFSVTAANGSTNLRAMLPVNADEKKLAGLTVNGSAVTYTTETIKGIQYAFFPASSGNYIATYDTDEAGPQISGITITQAGAGTATIKWTTNEASDSRVNYGTASGQLNQNASDADLVTSHTVTFSGLTAGTTYYFRVVSADAAGNSTVMPATSAAALSFTTPAANCFEDVSASNFNAGTTGNNTYVTSDGVILKPAVNEEFTVLPPTSEWQSYPWPSGGSSTNSGGQMAINGARFNTEPVSATFSPGTSVEFVATFEAETYQSIGFGAGNNSDMFNSTPWIMFGTGSSNNSLQARVAINPSTTEDITLLGSYLGSAHRYKIVWKLNGVDFYVDNDIVHSSSIAVTTPMRFGASDYVLNSSSVKLDWARISPYASEGSFTSRVYDGGTDKTWQIANWAANLPSGTDIKLFQRQGNSSNTTDDSWTEFTPIASSGSNVGGTSRYIQYRADLSTTNPAITPVLISVSISCSAPSCPAVVFTPASGTALPAARVGDPYSQDINTNLSGYTFTATGLPSGLSINSSTGLISGTPATAGTNMGITITATKGNCSENASYTITVNPANSKPVLATIGNKTITLGQTLTFTANASDPDDGQTKTFSLSNAPSGATINASTGAFSWKPASAGTFSFTVTVTDDGSPSLSDSETITVTVNTPANSAPVLATIGNKTVTLGQTLTFTATATDPDAGQTRTFSLSGNGSGATIDMNSGAFSWKPASAGTFSFTVTVTDNGSPSLSDSETITVTVNTPANSAPVLATIGNKTVTLGQTLTFTATATDPDAGQTRTFSLTNAPSGATINATSGAFSWKPTATGTFSFTVKVADNGSPSLSDSETITVTVNSPATTTRINVGGSAYTASGNRAFIADKY
ncbi:N,N-dimethylformamidase beta subunit family domain-containing protein, partial [Dyadobacter flavalbus]|uniref:N,N-dimethylformamidase beta subunit family domain-containing protein n=1 Tax=Dyadobacter flavalbus TaxID=2579942 RepID=UPI001375BC84